MLRTIYTRAYAPITTTENLNVMHELIYIRHTGHVETKSFETITGIGIISTTDFFRSNISSQLFEQRFLHIGSLDFIIMYLKVMYSIKLKYNACIYIRANFGQLQ